MSPRSTMVLDIYIYIYIHILRTVYAHELWQATKFRHGSVSILLRTPWKKQVERSNFGIGPSVSFIVVSRDFVAKRVSLDEMWTSVLLRSVAGELLNCLILFWIKWSNKCFRLIVHIRDKVGNFLICFLVSWNRSLKYHIVKLQVWSDY